MKHISEVILKLLEETSNLQEYRPPKLESPIERHLYEAFRFCGLNVETQINVGNFRIDMVVTSKINAGIEIFVECDGAQFHHPIVDDFRDDELVKLTEIPITHFSGKWINNLSCHLEDVVD